MKTAKISYSHLGCTGVGRFSATPLERGKRGRGCILCILLLCLCMMVETGVAQVVPPGVPEPGLVIWGTVVNQTNVSQALTISSATWSVTDGTKTAVYWGGSHPPTRIVNLNGQSYYILQVPFDTRQVGTVTLADPATVGIDSFALKSTSPPTYTLMPTINGALATVRSIDGAPGSGTNVPVAGFTSATRGRVIRVDLAIIPTIEDFNTWAARIFGSANLPEAQPTADPDGDGFNNAAEHAAGTNPKDATSALRILTLTRLSHGLTVFRFFCAQVIA